jgi:hypothetical protein
MINVMHISHDEGFSIVLARWKDAPGGIQQVKKQLQVDLRPGFFPRCIVFPSRVMHGFGCHRTLGTTVIIVGIQIQNLARSNISRLSATYVLSESSPLPPRDQFRHVLSHFLTSMISDSGSPCTRNAGIDNVLTSPNRDPGLKKIAPYWYPYTTMAKGRWLGREILEVVSTEFRDRSMEYYVGRSISIHVATVSNHSFLKLEICLGVGCHYNKWPGCKT